MTTLNLFPAIPFKGKDCWHVLGSFTNQGQITATVNTEAEAIKLAQEENDRRKKGDIK
jgi:hypothetical protein